MTVQQLMEALSKMDPNKPVFFAGTPRSDDPVLIGSVEEGFISFHDLDDDANKVVILDV